jgi:hypothetical protein
LTRTLTFPRPPLWVHVAVLLTVVAAIYGPDIGRGFVKDDFRWILASRVRSAGDLTRLFVDTTGFYRPLVSLSFAANERLGGASPKGYGVTNLALALATAVAIACLARALQVPMGACLFAAGVWLMNFHGINMALLWMSGRTALLLTLFAVLAAIAASRGRPAVAAILAFAAMLSKEEAVLLPVTLIVILALVARGRLPTEAQTIPRAKVGFRPVALALVYCAAAEIGYLVLRRHSNAMTPGNAPDFYQFIVAPAAVFRNILQYADRAATLTVLLLVLLLAITRRRPALDRAERTAVTIGAVWVVAGFAVTVFLPVRSSLYACFPSVGVALAGAAVASALWRAGSAQQQAVAATVVLILPFLLIPIYRQRNVRWVELAVLSSNVTPALQEAARIAAHDENILIVDDRSTRVSMLNTFGFLLADAVELTSSQRRTVWLVPAAPGAPPEHTTQVPRRFESAWALRDGRLQQIDGADWIGAGANVLR